MTKLFLFLSLLSFKAMASDDGRFLDRGNPPSRLEQKTKSMSAEEIYRRTQIVLNYFQVPAEKNYQSELDAIQYSTSSSSFNQHLKNLDPSGQFGRFYSVAPDSIQSFKDRDAKQLAEYQMLIPPSRLSEKKSNSLQGVRIALDPGHMGGDYWDEITGKYVQQGKKRVSEGTIALQTAMLIEKKLKQLGAEVLITHRELGPASPVPYDQMDLLSYARQELRYQSLQDWFQELILTTNEADLPAKFSAAAPRKKLFSDVMRGDYYATREDLFYRNEMIKNFKPDMVIVIHFDAGTSAPSATAHNQSFAYVVGNFPNTDFSTSEIRERILAHLSQEKMWQKSVDLSRALLTEMNQDLHVPLAQDAPWGLPVAPGVFTRNLVLSRQNTYSPLTYLECLYYANQAEFDRMSTLDGGTLEIGGKTYPYPNRLNVLANAITNGIINYQAAQ